MYKKWSKAEIEKEIIEVSKRFNYPCNIPVEISNRASRRLGAFFYKKELNKIKPVKFVFAKILLDGLYTEDIVREVIIHEYIHYFCDTKTGKSNGHNKLFKDICIKIGISSRATFQYNLPKGQVDRKDRKEYRVYCSNCRKDVAIHFRKDAADRKVKDYISKCCNSRLKYHLVEKK